MNTAPESDHHESDHNESEHHPPRHSSLDHHLPNHHLPDRNPRAHEPFAHKPLAVIIGMPGAGKTRIGSKVSELLGVRCVDVDAQFEQLEGMSIPDFFDRFGEDAFRAREAQILADLLHRCDGVLSCGGGSPMHPQTQRRLRSYAQAGGTIVYLQADPVEAIERVRRNSARPLLARDAERTWWQLHEHRHPVFRELATVEVNTHALSVNAAARKVITLMNQRTVQVQAPGFDDYAVHMSSGQLCLLPTAVPEGVMRIALLHTQSVQRYSDRVRTSLRQRGFTVVDMLIPDAERGKTIEVVTRVWASLADHGFTRSDLIIGIGGGALTDVAGFIAATWMRGIRYINCPTSLLAMVDASTGGKTGINIAAGKNLVGSFYTPVRVLADIDTLRTLPNDIFTEGLGEVVKSGFIADSQILRLLDEHAEALAAFGPHSLDDRELAEVIAELVERTVRVKVDHVKDDVRERGMREFLNYGHTLGHAIEQVEQYTFRHGNAVAIGMMFAAVLAESLGMLSSDEVAVHERMITRLGLPTSWHGADFDHMLDLMRLDKKTRGASLRLVLLQGLGNPVVVTNPDRELMRAAFERMGAGTSSGLSQ